MKLLTQIITLLATAISLNAAERPNIILVLVDDLGYADVGFNGSSYYETPTIDALANDGLMVEYAYTYPTCSPSRTALATGKQSFRTGVYTVPVLEKGDDQENIFSRWTVGEEHTMYSEPLADSGYKAAHLGKWHLVGPYPEFENTAEFPLKEKLKQPDPWDYSWAPYHKSEACDAYYPRGRGYLLNVAGTYRGDPALEIDGYKGPTGGFFAPFNNPFMDEKNPDDNWLTDHLTTKAIEFMDVHKEDGPFFINLHYYTVHAPLRARSDELFQKYMNKPGDPHTGQGMNKGPRHKLEAMYATMIESLDDNMARIVDFLEANNLRDNTLIIFTSDNGQNNRSNDLLRDGKGFVYEGGIRAPTFFNWPGKINPRRTDVPVMLTDYFPTFMELAGIDYQGVLDGKSVVPLFGSDNPALKKRPLFWHIASQYRHGTCSVIRKNNYKLIQFLKDGSIELYDLASDPLESKNLAKDHPELATTLLGELVEWRVKNDVPLPPESPLSK